MWWESKALARLFCQPKRKHGLCCSVSVSLEGCDDKMIAIHMEKLLKKAISFETPVPLSLPFWATCVGWWYFDSITYIWFIDIIMASRKKRNGVSQFDQSPCHSMQSFLCPCSLMLIPWGDNFHMWLWIYWGTAIFGRYKSPKSNLHSFFSAYSTFCYRQKQNQKQ